MRVGPRSSELTEDPVVRLCTIYFHVYLRSFLLFISSIYSSALGIIIKNVLRNVTTNHGVRPQRSTPQRLFSNRRYRFGPATGQSI